MSKKLLRLTVYSVLIATLALMPVTQAVAHAANSLEPDWVPPVLDATPSSQNVTSVDSYRAEWTVCIYEGVGTYTMDFWSGDGGHYTRPYVSHDSCEGWTYYYKGSTGWYNQTWKITGQGGPDYDYTSVHKY